MGGACTTVEGERERKREEGRERERGRERGREHALNHNPATFSFVLFMREINNFVSQTRKHSRNFK